MLLLKSATSGKSYWLRSYALALAPLAPCSRRRRGKTGFYGGFSHKLPLLRRGADKPVQLRKSYKKSFVVNRFGKVILDLQ